MGEKLRNMTKFDITSSIGGAALVLASLIVQGWLGLISFALGGFLIFVVVWHLELIQKHLKQEQITPINKVVSVFQEKSILMFQKIKEGILRVKEEIETQILLYQYEEEQKKKAEQERLAAEAKAREPKFVAYRIVPERADSLSPLSATSLIRALSDRLMQPYSQFSLQIDAYENSADWIVTHSSPKPIEEDQLRLMVQAHYPNAEVFPDVVGPLSSDQFPMYETDILIGSALDSDLHLQSSHVDEVVKDDPLIRLFDVFAQLNRGERIRIEFAVYDQYLVKEPQEYLQESLYDQGHRPPTYYGSAADIISKTFMETNRLKNTFVDKYPSNLMAKYRQKLLQPLLVTRLAVKMYSPEENRLSLLGEVGRVMQLYSTNEARFRILHTTSPTQLKTQDEWFKNLLFEFLDNLPIEIDVKNPGKLRLGHTFMYLLPEEVAAIWHLPYVPKGYTRPVNTNFANTLPQLATSATDSQAVEIAYTTKNGKVSGVRIPNVDRGKHSFITGRPGYGKSTFMHNLIRQDIAAGQGVLVLDPHRVLIDDILKNSIPPERLKDVYLLECENLDYPVPLNPFRVGEGVPTFEAKTAIMWILKTLYTEQWSKLSMETVLENTIQLLLLADNPTPRDIRTLLLDDKFRQQLIDKAKKRPDISISLLDYWIKQYNPLSPSKKDDRNQPVFNRLGALLNSPYMELMTCHPNSLPFRQLISDKAIVLVDLKGSAIRGEIGTLGTIFMEQYYLGCVGLGELRGNDVPRCYVYVDETHTLMNGAIPTIFSEGRKYGMAMTLSDQWIGQLDSDMARAISNTVGTKIAFGVADAGEASAMAKLFVPNVTDRDLLSLSVGEAAVSTSVFGAQVPPFKVTTLPPPSGGTPAVVEELRQQTREKLGLISGTQVREWIINRYVENADDGLGDTEEK